MKKSEIDDLKEYMSTLMLQQTDLLRGEIREIEGSLQNRFDETVEQLSRDIGDAVVAIQESNDNILGNHERRITKLENATS